MDRRHFLAAGLAAALPARASARPGVARIVSSLPRTGAAKGQTDTIVNAIRLAIDADREPAPGLRVLYSDWDDATAAAGKWDAAAEAANARRAAADEEVVAVIGPYNSGAAKVSMPILNEAGVVQISPACTWPGLTKKVAGGTDGEPDIYRPANRITFCRICPTDDIQGPFAATFAATELKATTAVILHDGELYGQGLATDFAAGCETHRIRVLTTARITPTDRNQDAAARMVRDRNPDVVFFGGTTQTGAPALARALHAARVRGPLIVPDGCYERAFLESAGADALNGRCYATLGGTDVPLLGDRGAAFVRAYKDRFKTDPEAYAIYGYEAARAVLAAIRTAGAANREAVRKALLGTANFEGGVLPRWGFDRNGDTTLKQLTVSRVAGGQFEPMKVVTG
ncbi:MAG TPA: branched-chain amino acid ABC transporter substrate-binding protein [Urbifossiella sp.]|nr:branched-chain amino acid ABC transporter substrate-binding protein [Urbifossiella sp.]